MSLTTFDADAVRAFTREFEHLFDVDDAPSMTSYYTDDAQIMADGMRPIRGRTAIAEFWHTAIDRAVAVGAHRRIELHECASSGDLGYALCTVTVELPASALVVWDATVWRRDPDGQWRITVDISTPLPESNDTLI